MLFVGLDRAVPNCAVALHVDCEAEGHGIDPTNPPWVWEALGADGWVGCDVEDGTGGFNTPGDVIVHVPASHVEAVLEERSGGWLRCRIVAPIARRRRRPYTDTPLLKPARRRDDRRHGRPRCTARTSSTSSSACPRACRASASPCCGDPVVASERPTVVEVAGPDGWEPWQQVQGFGESGADDHHWRLNANDGAIFFGPAVRLDDGSMRQYGAVPPAGAHVRVRRYRTGGGRLGNVAAHEIVTLKSAVPFIGRVDNRRAATGGVDGETLDAAKVRGPLVLGHPQPGRHGAGLRAAGPGGDARGRPRPLPARRRGRAADDRRRRHGAAGVRVLIVPAVSADESGRFTFEQLVPPEAMMATVRDYLDERRMIGARVVVTPPRYLGVTAVIRLRARPAGRSRRAPPAHRSRPCTATSTRCAAGRRATGGRSAARSCSARCSASPSASTGVDLIEDARMFPADPISGQRGEAITRIDLDPDSLVFSYGHQVQVVT